MNFRSAIFSLIAFVCSGFVQAQEATSDAAAGATSSFGASSAATSTPGDAVGLGGSATAPADLESSQEAAFTVPNTYGRSPVVLSPGEGRLARPRFRFHANLSVGYDDNIFQASSNSRGTPDTVVDDRVILGTRAQERVGSFVTRGTIGADFQFAARRTALTFDISGGTDYYWNRGGDPSDYDGSLSLIFVHRLTPRMQFSATVGAAYFSQPDFSLINAPSNLAGGSYFTFNSKSNLSYRLTPRLSTVVSVSYNAVRYEDVTNSSDYGETIFGTELRYLFSPRITLLGELRYSSISFSDSSSNNSNTLFLLAGGDLTISRRFTATLRVGAAIQSSSDSSRDSTDPFVESTLQYRIARGTFLEWNNRYGFEESTNVSEGSQSFRTGLRLSHAFSTRLRGSVYLNYVHHEQSAAPLSEDSSEDIVDFGLSVDYALTKRWSLNANYSFTSVTSDDELGDYYRNRIFAGVGYQF